MPDPNTYKLGDVSEHLAKAGAVLGIVAVGMAFGPQVERATSAVQARGTSKAKEGFCTGKPIRGAQDISTAVAIGVHGNQPAR